MSDTPESPALRRRVERRNGDVFELAVHAERFEAVAQFTPERKPPPPRKLNLKLREEDVLLLQELAQRARPEKISASTLMNRLLHDILFELMQRLQAQDRVACALLAEAADRRTRYVAAEQPWSWHFGEDENDKVQRDFNLADGASLEDVYSPLARAILELEDNR